MPRVGSYVRNYFTGETVKVVGHNSKGFAWIPVEVKGGFVYRDGFHAYNVIKHRKGTK